MVKSLNGQIREAAYKLEDTLESHVTNRSERLEEAKEEINSFIERVKKIEKMMMEERNNPLHDEEVAVSSSVDFGGKNSKMVGLSEEVSYLKDLLLNDSSSGRDVISIVGMAGIGKTALAMKIFEDPSISSHFDYRVFVTVGLNYRFKNIMLSILAQMNHDINEIHLEEDEKLCQYILRSLQGRRYLIVLDDVWSMEDFEELESFLPKESIGSRVLMATRLEVVAQYAADTNLVYYMPFLSEEESWDLLRERVFGEGHSCPFQLEKFGKKIAEKCEGLPLTIVTVVNILSKREKTLEYWKKVAKKENSVFNKAYDQMSEVLISSYNYLPHYLKPCFLYMGVFPLSCKIPASKLFKLWRSEGLLYPNPLRDTEYSAKECLQDLVSNSIVLANQWSSTREDYIKICMLHSVYWHLCVKEASKEKFFHVMNRYASNFTEVLKNQRRLCIHNNVLFGIKEIRNSIESTSMARSLLCTGSHHQYPVPICFGLRLLRVLDALTIHFYRFPIEVLKLVQLKYLALKYNGKVPSSISELRNLEHLIVLRHLNINKSSAYSSYLPVEIWNMKTLRHIQVTGGNLPNPCGAFLHNLLTLSDMSVSICRKEILKKTPNLKKLGIQIELTPDAIETLCFFDHLSHLYYLESLKCVVVNPKPKSQVVASITTFPYNLTKLSLSGLGYPWKYMGMIAKMPNLKVLKLRCYTFQGPVWLVDQSFWSLEYLLIEDTDLMQWRANDIYRFPILRHLIIRHCYKLKEIPSSFGCYCQPVLMELVDCSSFRASVEQLQGKYRFSHIYVPSSLDDEKLKSS